MSPNAATLLALIIAVLVFLAVYYWGNLTWMASLAIGAIVGIILQWIFLGTFLAELRNLSGDQITAQISNAGFAGLMSLIYVLIIVIVLIVYAVRDKRLVL